MKKKTCFIAAGALLIGFIVGWLSADDDPVMLAQGGPVTGKRERVELVTWRTEMPHAGCVSNGAWQVSGQPRQIASYAIDKNVWPHKCTGCGETNEIYDATWPKFEREWRAVR